MLITQEQARQKWCPMVRIARRENTEPDNAGTEVIAAGVNTDALGRCRVPQSCCCIANDCAMWRWADGDRETGYCGLAGVPAIATLPKPFF